MTINLKKIIIFICIFFLIFLATKPTWKSLPEILIFQNGDADIYFGQHLKPQKSLKINFSNDFSGNESVFLKRNNKKVKPISEQYPYLFFKVIVGDSLCTENLCKILEKDGYLIKKLGSNGWWSTRFAMVHNYELPIDRTFSLYSNNVTSLFFVKPNFHKFEFHSLKQGNNNFHISKFGHFKAWRLIYAVFFSCVCTSLIFLIYQSRQKIVAIFYNVPFYSIGLGCLLIIEYLAVFPGIFSTDTVVNHLSTDVFSIWYSPVFMLFNRFIYSLYPNFIQLPEIFIFYISSVYLASHLKKIHNGNVIIFSLLLSQIIFPVFFVSIFIQQRIFLSVIILYAAIIFSCCNILNRGKITPIAYCFLIFAVFLRPEYCLIFVIFFLYDVWQRKKILILPLKPTIYTLICALFSYFFINYPLVWIQGTNRNDIVLNYQLVSLLDIVKPYVDCNNKEDNLSQAIERSGGLKDYCSMSAENFFWSRSHGNIDNITNVNKIIKHEFYTRIISNPQPEIKRIFSNIAEMSLQNYWQIYNRYSYLDQENNNYHIKTAERFGLINFFSWQIKLHTDITQLFKWLSNYLNVLISLIFVTILVPIISRCKFTIIINSMFLFMVLGVGFAAPVAQWSYLIFIPIWSVLIIPIDAILYARIKNN